LSIGFDHLGQLLRESDPLWLASVWNEVQPQLLTMGQLCLQLGGAWPLTWYLRTQGVRSQRMAVMQSDDPEVQALYRDWLALDSLAQQITARSSSGLGPTWKGNGPDDLSAPLRGLQTTPQNAPDAVAALHQQWAALNKQVHARKQALAHLLPEQRAITLPVLHKHLPQRQAVVALVELSPGMACLTAHWGASEGSAQADGKSNAPHWQRWSTTVDLAAARSGLGEFELAWLATSDAQLAALARQARGADAPRRGLAAPATPMVQAETDGEPPLTPDLSPEAVAHYVQSLRTAAQPLWAHLQAQGIERVHWLVNGHLHAVPWLLLLGADAQAQGLAWRQYPHAAAWLACHDTASAAPTLAQQPTLPPSAMAWLGHDAQELRHMPRYPDLPSTALECGVGQQAWASLGVQGVNLSPQQPQWQAQAGQSAVQALFVLAHGDAPSVMQAVKKAATQGATEVGAEGDQGRQAAKSTVSSGAGAVQVAQAAIVLGCQPNGQTRYFTAAQLRQVQHARHVVFNSCITGRSQEVMAETLGLLAQAFDHEAHFVLGAMVRVDDWEAMLIGSAYQYALMRQWQQGQAPDWAETFAQLQTQVQNGHWPEGFTDFLAQAWKDWCRCLRARVGENDQDENLQDELRAQLNTWLNVQGLQKKTSWRDSNWDADWEQLAHSVRRPSALAQRTVVWYIAHGLGDA
jgi:hypothetical protein